MTSALIPLINADTEQYFVELPKLAPSEVEYGNDDIFDRGIYQTSDLKVGVDIPFELLCKLPCSHWTENDRIDLNTLALKHVTFQATNKVTGVTQILTTGDLYGISGGKALPVAGEAPNNRRIDYRVRHFSTRLLKAVTAEPVTVFGNDEGQHCHFQLSAEYLPYIGALISSASVDKCSNKDVELTIIGFALHAEHERVGVTA